MSASRTTSRFVVAMEGIRFAGSQLRGPARDFSCPDIRTGRGAKTCQNRFRNWYRGRYKSGYKRRYIELAIPLGE